MGKLKAICAADIIPQKVKPLIISRKGWCYCGGTLGWMPEQNLKLSLDEKHKWKNKYDSAINQLSQLGVKVEDDLGIKDVA